MSQFSPENFRHACSESALVPGILNTDKGVTDADCISSMGYLSFNKACRHVQFGYDETARCLEECPEKYFAKEVAFSSHLGRLHLARSRLLSARRSRLIGSHQFCAECHESCKACKENDETYLSNLGGYTRCLGDQEGFRLYNLKHAVIGKPDQIEFRDWDRDWD